jgi:hypothetical protein
MLLIYSFSNSGENLIQKECKKKRNLKIPIPQQAPIIRIVPMERQTKYFYCSCVFHWDYGVLS